MLVPAVFAVLMKMNLYLWDRIIANRWTAGTLMRAPATCRRERFSASCGNTAAPMISFQKRFLFIHIPKTAGNSIQSVLRDYSEDQLVALRKEQDGIERFGLRNPKYKIKKHSTLSEYHDALGDEQFRNLYKFTCVRNPWDRMVSYYFTPTQNPETWNRKKFRRIISKAVSVADYLRLDNGEENPFANVDYIMRFENLADDFRAVCRAIGISPPALPQYNRSTRQHYSKYYDGELREFVRSRFAAEIERFEYVFEEQ
jgi:Sulfotransferase family